MSRRTPTLFLGVALLGLAAGCRSSCGDRFGWLSSNSRSDAPCQLVGNARLPDGCYDPISGQSVPCPPPTTVIPGGALPPGTPPRADELPFPGPADMIPPTGVPAAPPSAAPAPFGGASLNPKREAPGKPATKQ